MERKTHRYAMAAITLVVVGLLYNGLRLLTAPPALLMAHSLFLYEGLACVTLAAMLIWFRRWAIQKLVGLFLEMHRLISALLIAGIIGAESMMHALSIPHMEGWWIPLLGGGAITTVSAWVQTWKKRSRAGEIP